MSGLPSLSLMACRLTVFGIKVLQTRLFSILTNIFRLPHSAPNISPSPVVFIYIPSIAAPASYRSHQQTRSASRCARRTGAAPPSRPGSRRERVLGPGAESPEVRYQGRESSEPGTRRAGGKAVGEASEPTSESDG